MSRFALGLSLAATLASGQALAADLLQWQDNSLTYLNGIDFKVDPPEAADRHLRACQWLELWRPVHLRRWHQVQHRGHQRRR